MEGQRQPGGEEVNGAFRDLSAEIQESLRERIQMEGQREQAVETRPSLPREIMAVALPPRITTTVTISISGEHMSDNNSVTSSCPICYDDFKFGEYAGQLNCGHVYHPNCISLWTRRHNTCPVCRAYQ
jgi:hypothetical protein